MVEIFRALNKINYEAQEAFLKRQIWKSKTKKDYAQIIKIGFFILIMKIKEKNRNIKGKLNQLQRKRYDFKRGSNDSKNY